MEIQNEQDVYDPNEHGMITHIHIYFSKEGPFKIMANLTFSFGVLKTIVWNNTDERKFYLPGIDGYTLFIDDRVKDTRDSYALCKAR